MIKILRTTEESGRSMVEMLGVLAIVGVLSIGGITGYSKAMAKYKINKTLDQISMLITNIRTTYGNQSSYAGLSVANAIAYDIVGNDLSQGSSTSLKNAYNGDVEITASSSAAKNGTCTDESTYCPYFIITFKNVEKAACAAIASADWGGSISSGLIQISIGNNDHTWDGNNSTTDLPITFGTAASQCSDATDMIWIYN